MQKKQFIVLFLCLAALICSCSPSSKINENTIFRYNEYRNITSLDPAFARNPQNIWPINQLFNGLVQLDKNLSVQPEIASTWTVSSDGLLYTFFLKKDIYFHTSPLFGEKQTRTVVASDFVYSFDRLKDPKVASPGGWVLQQVKSYRAIDPQTFSIKLKKPFPAFLGLLSMRYCAVVPHEVVSHFGSRFRSNPIGTGPFYFKRWDENVKLVLKKNNNYFEHDKNGQKLPYLEAVAIQFIPDIQSEFMLFLQGKLDFINSLDASYKDELLTPKGALQSKYKERINMLKGPYLNTEYIGFYLDADNPAIQSEEIREAMNLGFDRKLMIAYLRNNIGYPANQGFIPKGLKGTSSKPYPHDVERARVLVKKYRVESGVKPTLTIATDANYLDLCEYLQRELQKIGIDLKIEVMPTASLRQAKSSGKLELFRASWIADYPDAENYLSLFYSKNLSPNGPNYTHYVNSKFDLLYEKALGTLAEDQRQKRYRQMDSLVNSEHPIIPLYYDQVIRFVQKNVEGMEINPINLLVLKTISKK